MSVIVVLCMLVGCGSNRANLSQTTGDTSASTPASSGNTTPEVSNAAEVDPDNPWAHLDLSEPETITCYFVGSLDEDWNRVVGMAKEKIQAKINTTIEFVHVPYSDFTTKYALFLAGDENIDMIYAAEWCNYTEHMKSGAFHGFDWNFVETYMPLTAQGQAEASWREASYGGKIWGVPRNDTYVMGSGVLTTRDLLDKYGWSEETLTTKEDLYEYMFDIAEGEQGTGVYALNPQSSWPSDSAFYTGANYFFDIGVGSATWMLWRYNEGKKFNPDDMFWYADSPEFLEYAKLMAEFNKTGVFPADVMGNQNLIDDNFREGLSAIQFGVPNSTVTEMELAERGKEMVYLDCLFTKEKQLKPGNYMGYAMCFPSASKKLERAAVALDCMKFDPEINRLMVGGIEGEHYILDEATNTRELGPDSSKYNWGSWLFLLQHDNDPKLKLREDIQALEDRYLEQMVSADVFPLNGFTYDPSKYESEIAVLSAIYNEYRFSFGFGIFQDNTEAKYEQFMNECRAAGLDDIVTDIKAQVKEFISQDTTA